MAREPLTPSSVNRKAILRRCEARISSFVARSQSWRLNGPIAFLRRRVDELLVGLVRLALVDGFGVAPRLDLAVERLGERRMLVQRVLEARREVDLRRLDRREMVEELVGQGRGPVLDGPGQTIRAGDLAKLAQDREVQLHVRDAATGERDAAVRRPGLHADLADPDRAGRPRVELAAVPVEVCPQLLDRRVLRPDLADLPADADRHAVGLERPDQGGQLRGAGVVLALLRVGVRLGQVHERRRVDVDVAIAGVHREAAGAPDLLGHGLGVGGVLLGVELVVVALDEDRPAPAGGHRPGQHRGGVVDRALERVGLLAPGELEDDRPDVGGSRGLVHGPGHVEGLRPEVDGGDGEPGDLAAGTRLVQALDARRSGAERLARLPDQPLRRGRRGLVRAEGRGPGEVADRAVAERRFIVDDEPVAVEMGRAAQGGEQVGWRGRDVGHRSEVSSFGGQASNGTARVAGMGRPPSLGVRAGGRWWRWGQRLKGT